MCIYWINGEHGTQKYRSGKFIQQRQGSSTLAVSISEPPKKSCLGWPGRARQRRIGPSRGIATTVRPICSPIRFGPGIEAVAQKPTSGELASSVRNTLATCPLGPTRRSGILTETGKVSPLGWPGDHTSTRHKSPSA